MKQDIRSLLLYEDSSVIVCHKPAGLAVQTNRIGSPDLASLLKNHLSQTSAGKTGSPKSPYLAVIHRLDQPVEGLLVFAKTPKAAKELNRQLTSSGFGKHYLAVVRGCPQPREGTLEDYMVKDGRINTSRICAKGTPGAKCARLSYRVRETDGDTSLVEIRLDTGRHHQIRVQMAHLGCPLIGDRKYGAPGPGEKESTGPLKLCAYKLEFAHPEGGRKMEFVLEEVFR